MGFPYPLLAAAATTLDRIEKIPMAFWLRIGAAGLAVIVIYIALRAVLKINKFVLGGAAFIGAGLLWFNWIAPFCPAAGAYQTKQAGTPDIAPTPKPKPKR